MSGLSDALGAANSAGLSARAIARAAKERGYTVNHDTAARYLRGTHGTPDEATLVAFADVLGVPPWPRSGPRARYGADPYSPRNPCRPARSGRTARRIAQRAEQRQYR